MPTATNNLTTKSNMITLPSRRLVNMTRSLFFCFSPSSAPQTNHKKPHLILNPSSGQLGPAREFLNLGAFFLSCPVLSFPYHTLQQNYNRIPKIKKTKERRKKRRDITRYLPRSNLSPSIRLYPGYPYIT